MLDATRTTTRQRILDMYASNNNNIFAAGAAADLDRATTARPGVYDGVGTWFAQSYQPAYGDLTAEKMQIDEGHNGNGKRLLARTLGKGKEKEEPQRNGREGFRLAAKDPLPDVPEVRLEPGRSPWEVESFAPADVGVYSRTGEAQGGNPMELRYYFTNFDF